jgi:endonuclease III
MIFIAWQINTLSIFSSGLKAKVTAEINALQILQTLKSNLATPKLVKLKTDSFETLVLTIISQNTADRNTERAYEKLSKQFEITPQILSEAETSKLEACLHIGGLYKNKAKTIKKVSQIILNKFGGSLNSILSLPLDEARKKLLELPGIGPKTSDVVLLFSANQPTIPVDTHVNRVAKRLGFSPPNGDYEEVRLSLQKLFNPKNYLNVHLLLIAHGRKYCKAGRPHCSECPVEKYCPSNSLEGKHD